MTLFKIKRRNSKIEIEIEMKMEMEMTSMKTAFQKEKKEESAVAEDFNLVHTTGDPVKNINNNPYYSYLL